MAKKYDPLSPPPWVRDAMAGKARVVRVKATPKGIDDYIADLAARAPQEWQDAIAAAIARPVRKGRK